MSGGAGFTGALRSRLATAERNIAVNTLRDIIDAGWSYLLMVAGIADEFEDQTGVDDPTSTNETYDASGDYYHNPTTYTLIDRTAGTIIGNMNGGSQQGNGFDGNLNQAATSCAYTAAQGQGRLGKNFGGSPKRVRRVVVTSSNNLGFNFSVGGANSTTLQVRRSDNGTDWTVVASDVFNNANSLLTRTIDFADEGERGYWDVTVVDSTGSGSNYCIGEVQFYERNTAPDMVLVSEEFTAEAAPNTARVVLLHQPVDAVTLNTDCTIEASRDGGTTWTAGALSDQGAFDATTNILAAEIDLSGQPNDTAVKWRFKTLNAKEQRLHGVWLQWG